MVWTALLLCCLWAVPGITAAQQTDTATVEEIEEVEEIEVVEDFDQRDATAEGLSLPDLLGRMHPAVVHFPIAWLLLLTLVEMVALFSGRPSWSRAGKGLLLLTILSLIPAAGTGLLRASSMESGADISALVEWHRNLNLAAASLCGIAGILRFRLSDTPRSGMHVLYTALVALACGLMMIAGHLGGKMVFGTEFLPF